MAHTETKLLSQARGMPANALSSSSNRNGVVLASLFHNIGHPMVPVWQFSTLNDPRRVSGSSMTDKPMPSVYCEYLTWTDCLLLDGCSLRLAWNANTDGSVVGHTGVMAVAVVD